MQSKAHRSGLQPRIRYSITMSTKYVVAVRSKWRVWTSHKATRHML